MQNASDMGNLWERDNTMMDEDNRARAKAKAERVNSNVRDSLLNMHTHAHCGMSG